MRRTLRTVVIFIRRPTLDPSLGTAFYMNIWGSSVYSIREGILVLARILEAYGNRLHLTANLNLVPSHRSLIAVQTSSLLASIKRKRTEYKM